LDNTLKKELIRSAVRTAVFALIFGFIIACGNNSTSTPSLQPRTAQNTLVRLVSHLRPTMLALPSQLNTEHPILASVFQTASAQSSQLQQSFQGTSCGSDFPGSVVNYSGATVGFIPIQVTGEPDIQIPQATQKQACSGVFSQIGGGVDSVSNGTLTNPGIPMYLDGTLSTLVVTGRGTKGTPIRCSDLTTTVPVKDQDLVQPYFVIGSNSVILAIGINPLPFVCNLSIPTGEDAGFISVQWAKI
jgi:hypothetical protein